MHRDDIQCSALLEKERQTRRDEVAIDLEDRSTKKGTPPQPAEAGDIRVESYSTGSYGTVGKLWLRR